MSRDKPIDEFAAPSRETAILAIAGILVTAFGFVVAEGAGTEVVPRWPFVWREVAVAYFLCALPAARWPESWMTRKLSRLVGTCLAVAAMAAVWWGIRNLSQDSSLLECASAAMSAIRAGLAIVVATAALMLSRGLRSLGDPPVQPLDRETGTAIGWRLVAMLASVLFVVFLPAAFLESRQTDVQTKLGESLAQSRLGQARRLAAQLRVASPDLRIGNATIGQVSAELDDRVRQIEQQVARRLSPTATVPQRLERARLWAILGRVEEARKTLQPLVSADPPHPPACVLLGTAYEWAADFSTSLRWYRAAREGLLPHREWPAARPLLLQATKGIAYAQRKLGHLREAEAAYQQALELSPTADMYFLLAQFYEDGQQSAKALQHVRRAMELDRPRYDAAGRDLIDKLVTQHFGCLSVFRH